VEKMTIGFANEASITVSTQKFVNHPRTKHPWDRVINTAHTSDGEYCLPQEHTGTVIPCPSDERMG